MLAQSTDARIKADAARATGDVRAANAFFQAALKEYPEDPALRTRWGELFIATHQNNEAIKLFQEALEIDADYAPAKIGLAKIAAGRYEEKTREWAEQVINETPDQALEAHLMFARAALEDGAIEAGEKALDAALELAEDHDRSPLEIYALKAAVDLLRGTTDSPWTQRALALNAGYGDAYAIPAHFYVITRRYREAIALLQRAVEIEPDLYSAHAELGINLLRENKIDEARPHLELAYRGDPFSAPIVNTLRLIDSFDNFVLSQHPAKPAAPGSNAANNPGAILRLHKDEAAVLEPYVLDLVNRTIDTYSKRYGFSSSNPSSSSSIPITTTSPCASPACPASGSSASRSAISSRWTARRAGPTTRSIGARRCGTKWRTCSRSKRRTTSCRAGSAKASPCTRSGARARCRAGTFRCPCSRPSRRTSSCRWPSSIAASSARPTRPRSSCRTCKPGSSASTSRAASARRPSRGMLDEFRDGQGHGASHRGRARDCAGAIRRGFRGVRREGARHGRRRARALAGEASRGPAGRRGARIGGSSSRRLPRPSSSSPTTSTKAAPYIAKARAHRELDETALLTNTLLEYRRRGGYDPDALIALARALGDAERTDDAIDVFEDVLMVAPLRSEVHRDFGDRLAAANRPREALVEYQALLAMNPQDLADAHYRLAKTYVAVEDRAKGREHLLYALEIAPHYREAQQLLLEVVR